MPLHIMIYIINNLFIPFTVHVHYSQALNCQQEPRRSHIDIIAYAYTDTCKDTNVIMHRYKY